MLNQNNTAPSFFSFLALVGACVELDWLVQDLGFDEGFCAANWADWACEPDRCQGTWVDVDGECGEPGVAYPCEDCERQVALLVSFVAEQTRLFEMCCGGQYDETAEFIAEDLNPKSHRGLGECCHCGDLYQSWNDHECYGTRGEAHEARMMG